MVGWYKCIHEQLRKSLLSFLLSILYDQMLPNLGYHSRKTSSKEKRIIFVIFYNSRIFPRVVFHDFQMQRKQRKLLLFHSLNIQMILTFWHNNTNEKCLPCSKNYMLRLFMEVIGFSKAILSFLRDLYQIQNSLTYINSFLQLNLFNGISFEHCGNKMIIFV